MNRYPAWLNTLVLVILLTGILFALPNVYSTVPALQLADADGNPIAEEQLTRYARVLESEEITPEAYFIKDGRAVIRFNEVDDQRRSAELLRSAFSRNTNVALTTAPQLPDWMRNMGLNPMSLGLDLRGGVYVLLEVDMESAIESRLRSYSQDFVDRLRDERIRSRAEVADQQVLVRLMSATDLDAARDIVRAADTDVIITDGADGKSLRVRMSETQIRARQDFAIEQNITTIRNRVDQLGVACATLTMRLPNEVSGRRRKQAV